jgi:VWFA-related protein
MKSPYVAILGACLCLTSASAQQPRVPAPPQTPPGQPAVTFKAEVDYVDVDATVTDRQGNFVGGLTKDDFVVLEDGKPQKVEMFSLVDLPVDRIDRMQFSGRPVLSDVKTNQQSLAGRLYVIVLDDLDTSLFRTATVRRTARQFIERHFGANDTAAVVYTSGRTDAAQEFTGDRSLLLSAIDKFVGRKLRSAMLDKIDMQYQIAENTALAAAAADPNAAAPATNSGALSMGSSLDPNVNPLTRGEGYPDKTMDSEDIERGFRAQRVLEELKDLAEFMANVHGRRKALLLFSEGIDYDVDDIYGSQDANTIITATKDAITAAARGNVSIFGIDPRGMVGMSADVMDVGGLQPGDGPADAAAMSGFRSEIRLSQESLKGLSEETGGFASIGNDPNAVFDRIVKANSTYYVLGYYPPSHPRDGKFHKIEVRMKRPGLTVSSRKGYADPRGKTPDEKAADERARMARDARKGGADATSPELRAVLNSPMQQSGVSMLVQAAPFKGPTLPGASAPKEHSVALAIEIDGAPFRFESKNNGTMFADNLELSYFSLNEQGKPLKGLQRQFELSLKPDSYQHARQLGIRTSERLALPPGRYQIRIGLHEYGTGALGTVFYDLEVPDFVNEPLSASGILLTASASGLVTTLLRDEQLGAGLLPGPATSRRTFATGDELGLYAEIYDNVKNAAHSVSVVTRLISDDGREVFSARETRTPPPGSTGTSTYGLTKRITLKDVTPGRYLLQLEARADGGSKDIKPVTRETVLTVVPPPK